MKTSIARKVVMGLTGLFLITFLCTHLLVNSFSLVSAELFNKGSHFMATNPFIQIMQYVLAVGFIIHILWGVMLTAQNRSARGNVGYKKENWQANTGINAKSMIITGMLVLLFLILHLKDFFVVIKFDAESIGTATYTTTHGVEKILQNDFHLMELVFSNPLYVVIYVASFILLGIHLSHGFQSAFQSLGANHKKYTPFIKGFGKVYSILIAVGFSSIALFHYINSLN